MREYAGTGVQSAALRLASASQRRQELLRQLGVEFDVMVPHVNEQVLPGEPAQDYVRRLAREKAADVWRRMQLRETLERCVLGADTAVDIDGKILGKPHDIEHSVEMLLHLSGRTHAVYTAVALQDAQRLDERMSRSEVTFRRIEREEALSYWDTGEPRDKAGGYAIQGFGACFIAHVAGSYSGIVGLPLFETAQMLDRARVPRWRAARGRA